MSEQPTFQTGEGDLLPTPWALRGILSLIGFTSVIAQVTLMRELLVVFHGNELSLGAMLASWLFWTACGSGWLGRWLGGTVQPRKVLAGIEALLAFALPLTILAVRASKAFFQAIPGEILGPVPMFVTSFVTLSLFCLISGASFTVGSRLFADAAGAATATATGAVYVLEAAGSGLGGVLASLLLVRLLSSFGIATVLGLLNLLAAFALLAPLVGAHGRAPLRNISAHARSPWLRRAAIFAALAVLLIAGNRVLEPLSRRILWRGFDLVSTQNSLYGNLAVVSTGTSRSLFENGLIVATVPDAAAAEEAVHYALLEHPEPRRVLLIGGGLNGGVQQALAHPSVAHVDYVELDPAMFDIAARYFPEAWEQIHRDSRVRLLAMDGRRFLKGTSDSYDAIIVNLPDPHTAQLNRFYTEEFFREAKARLQSSGILSFQVTASENYLSQALVDFLSCLERTLRAVFPEVMAIPGDTVHFFAATRPGTLTTDPQELVRRLQARHLHTQYVREYFLPFRMSQDRMADLATQIAPQPSTPVNRDFAPVAYYFDVALWSTRYQQVSTRWIEAAASIGFRRLLAGALAALATLAALLWVWPAAPKQRTRVQARRAAAFAVAALGFTGLGLEVLLFMGFQALFGYVYQQLAILVGLYMAGLAAGAWWTLTGFSEKPTLAGLTVLQLLAAITPLALCGVFTELGKVNSAGGQWLASQVLFPALAFAAGLLGGFEFLLASRVYFAGHTKPASSPGILYALDLVGACAGALALSVLLIPIYGFLRTATLMAVVNLVPGALAAAAGRKHRSGPAWSRPGDAD